MKATVATLPTPATDSIVVSARPTVSQRRRQAARQRFPSRDSGDGWAATTLDRMQAAELLAAPPFMVNHRHSQQTRRAATTTLLDWLQDQPGDTWQQRWLASTAQPLNARWREPVVAWMKTHGKRASWRVNSLAGAIAAMIAADVIRPSLDWLLARTTGQGSLVRNMSAGRDPEGFTQLRKLATTESLRPSDTSLALLRTAMILATKGGLVADITVGDVLELLDTEAAVRIRNTTGTNAFYLLLHRAGALGPDAPESLRVARAFGQGSPEQLVDQYQLACKPIRDLLVEYLRERQPAVDYVSLRNLAIHLVGGFWADIERHHPGIDTLRLPADIVAGWKQRLRTKTTTITAADGTKTAITTERISYQEYLTPVRAFYLDLSQWALDDPARWGPWVAPSPVTVAELGRSKAIRQRKARVDARTRQRLPVLPILVRTVAQRRRDAEQLLAAARQTGSGQSFTAAGQTLIRTARGTSGKIWATDPATGKHRDLELEDEQAFWAFAAVEVLRATGIRLEELLELSHHSLIQYRLPTTGELVPLLQIAPSKTDTERLLVVSPELADVLSTIICRVRTSDGTIPLTRAYDSYERVWLPPSPLLFQRKHRNVRHGITPDYLRAVLTTAIGHSGLTDPATGEPLNWAPHDFRRIFITDAILNGLPPHIAQVIAGHRDINVTMGYKAVYPEEAIQAHLAFLARRRALRPSEEYRTPTDEEWQEFLGHFERRKVSIGTCARAFSTPCIHEHACVRCSMLWPDPAQQTRLTEIRDNLIARIAEAEREGWLGEVEGLKVSLTGAEDKLSQIDRRSGNTATINLGLPAIRNEER